MNLLILGPPGSGKGTEGKKIAENYNLLYISTGDLFRNEINKQTKLGIKFNEYVSHGLLVPDDLVMDLVKKQFKNSKKGFILDGFPRTLKQAIKLEKYKKIDKVIYLEASRNTITKRLSARKNCPKCGNIYGLNCMPKKENKCDLCTIDLMQREDDNPKKIEKRLQIYELKTKPLLEFYKERLIIINGNKDEEIIFKEILKKLN